MIKPHPNQERLWQLFNYCPDTGVLWWRKRPLSDFKTRCAFSLWNARYAGTLAGAICVSGGYVTIEIDTISYRAHRLVWIWHNGSIPADHDIDHLNGLKGDNRIHNLAPKTRSQNCMNKPPRANKSGHVGVHWHKQHQKWCAKVKVNGTAKHLGLFHRLEDAARVAAEARRKIGFTERHIKGALA